MQVFVQDLCHDVQTAGGGVAVEQNAQTDAHDEDVTQHIQLLTAGQRGVCQEKSIQTVPETAAAECSYRRSSTPNSFPQVKKPMIEAAGH